ncbi:MAG: hypothetical protein ACI9N1_002658 [Flavobacteriales bacterium]|jgi:hypothetical protein
MFISFFDFTFGKIGLFLHEIILNKKYEKLYKMDDIIYCFSNNV